MQERILKTKTVLNRMLSLSDEEYGLSGRDAAAQILHAYECFLLENGLKKENQYNKEDRANDGVCDRALTRIEKWLSLDAKKTNLPDYEDCMVLAASFDCEVRDFVFTDLADAEQGESFFDFSPMWYSEMPDEDTLSLEIYLPLIRGALQKRKTGEVRECFNISCEGTGSNRKISSDGRSPLDFVNGYIARHSLDYTAAEPLLKLINNVEVIWRRGDRLPPVTQLVAYERITGIAINRLYKERAEEFRCTMNVGAKGMSDGKQNYIEKLRISNLEKDKLELLCRESGYEIIGGGSDWVIIRKDEKSGLIAFSQGKRLLLEPKYDFVVKGKSAVCAIEGGKVFKVDMKEGAYESKEVSFVRFDEPGVREEAQCMVLQAIDVLFNKGYRYFDVDGSFWVLPPEGGILKARAERSGSGGGMNIKINDKGRRRYGLMLPTGLVIPPVYEEEIREGEGLYLVRKDNLYGYLDTLGNTVIPCIYADASPFSEGMASVCTGGKYGYISTSGECVIEPQYLYACDFSEGLAAVTVLGSDGKARDGYIDKSGRVVIAAVYESAYCFSGGVAAAVCGGRYGYIDREGRTVLPFIYGAASVCKDKTVRVLSGDTFIIKKLTAN